MDKYLLTIKEACQYFGIGETKLREMSICNINDFTIKNGNKFLINKKKLENHLDKVSEI